MAQRTVAELIAQFQPHFPVLKPAGANAAAIQNNVNQLIASIQANIAAATQSRIGSLGVPQATDFKPPIQGFTALHTSQRAPHPTPSAQLTRNLQERGFAAVRGNVNVSHVVSQTVTSSGGSRVVNVAT